MPPSILLAPIALFLLHITLKDLSRFQVPPWSTLALAAAGLLACHTRDTCHPPIELAAALGLLLICFLASELYYRLTARDGLGLGDVKLLAAASLVVGFQNHCPRLLIASTTSMASRPRQRAYPLSLAPHP